jgi:hypothetical protein
MISPTTSLSIVQELWIIVYVYELKGAMLTFYDEHLVVIQFLKKLCFYETRCEPLLHYSQNPWVSWIQSNYQQPISLKSFLILSSDLCHGIPICLFTSDFPTKIFVCFSFQNWQEASDLDEVSTELFSK